MQTVGDILAVLERPAGLPRRMSPVETPSRPRAASPGSTASRSARASSYSAGWSGCWFGPTASKSSAGATRVEELRQQSTPVVIAGWHERPAGLGRLSPVRLGLTRVSSRAPGEPLPRWRDPRPPGRQARYGGGARIHLSRWAGRPSAPVPHAVAPGPVRRHRSRRAPGTGARVQAGCSAAGSDRGVPVLPIASAASSAWRLGSWDRMIVPHPFARVPIVLGRALEVPASSVERGTGVGSLRAGRHSRSTQRAAGWP